MTSEEAAEQLATIAMSCVHAILAGQPTVTITTRGKRPKGFPRGELLSINALGGKNYAVPPVKALAWIHSLTSPATTQPGT